MHFNSLVTHTHTYTATVLISFEFSTGASLTPALCSSPPLMKLIQTLLPARLPSPFTSLSAPFPTNHPSFRTSFLASQPPPDCPDAFHIHSSFLPPRHPLILHSHPSLKRSRFMNPCHLWRSHYSSITRLLLFQSGSSHSACNYQM